MKIFFKTTAGAESVLDTDVLSSQALGLGPTGYGEEQWAKGAQMATEKLVMTIAVNGRWGAHDEPRTKTITAYERLGYHARTRELLEGFITAGGIVEIFGFQGCNGRMISWEQTL